MNEAMILDKALNCITAFTYHEQKTGIIGFLWIAMVIYINRKFDLDGNKGLQNRAGNLLRNGC